MSSPPQVALLPAPVVAEGAVCGLLLDGTVASRRAAVLSRLGLPAPVDPAALDPSRPRLLLRADAALSEKGLAAFLDGAAADARYALSGESGALLDQLGLTLGDPLAVYLAPGGPADPARIAAAPARPVDPAERVLPFAISATQQGGATTLRLPLSERYLLPTAHPLQLLWANLLHLPPFLWARLLSPHLPLALLRFLWALLQAGSVEPAALGAVLNRVGRRCRIHPRAVVEGCVIGDDVQIGANAVVRASVLGDGARVEELSLVDTVILGPKATIRALSLVKYSLIGPGAVAGGSMQMAVLDEEAAVKQTAVLSDQALAGATTRVTVNGVAHPAPFGLAGAFVGARSLVGATLLVAPGRHIPPDLCVLPDPAAALRRIAPTLRGRAAVRDGTAEPL